MELKVKIPKIQRHSQRSHFLKNVFENPKEMVYRTGSNSPKQWPFVLDDAAENRPNSLGVIV